jgi:hypothetical protein
MPSESDLGSRLSRLELASLKLVALSAATEAVHEARIVPESHTLGLAILSQSTRVELLRCVAECKEWNTDHRKAA